MPVVSEEGVGRARRDVSSGVSSSSIRSTARANFSPAATNTPSISRIVTRRRADRRHHRRAGARAVVARRCRRQAPSGCACGGRRRPSRKPIRTRRWPREDAVAAVSRSHLDPRPRHSCSKACGRHALSSGSALKFCRIAEGGADVYPRLAPTCEWDVAAGHARRCCRRRRRTTRKACRCALAASRSNFGCRPSSPGAIRQGAQSSNARLQRARCARPPAICARAASMMRPGSARKGRAPARYRTDRAARPATSPEQRMARHRTAARDRDRVVAAEARHIDVGMLRKGAAVAFIAEPPDRRRSRSIQLGRPDLRLAVGEIGDRIEAADREPGVAD